MSFSYGVRAAILGFGFFFLLHAVLGLAASAFSPSRIFERIRPSTAARLLLALRLLPALCGMLVTSGLVVPAYFQWELEQASEPVSLLITLAAAAGIFVWIQSLARSARALQSSPRLHGPEPQHVLETGELFLAVAGILRPRIIVSRGFLQSVPAAQREIAMRHEMAHFRAADNLKRLLMLLAPSIAPGCAIGYDRLEQAWARFAERAADDLAVGGEPERGAVLAEVLLTVARSGCHLRLALSSALVESQIELRARVERLFRQPDTSSGARDRIFTILCASLLLSPLGVAFWLVARGASQPFFHLIERLLLHA